MRALRKFWLLPPSDQSLLLEAVLWLGATRLGLWLLPLRQVRRLLARGGHSPVQSHGSTPSVERIAWAVSSARRVVPGATCLPQALTAEALLQRRGYSADLRIGVLRAAPGHLVAHAWVETDGRVVLGDLPDLAYYAPLPPLPRATP